jgi:hypothetical protein
MAEGLRTASVAIWHSRPHLGGLWAASREARFGAERQAVAWPAAALGRSLVRLLGLGARVVARATQNAPSVSQGRFGTDRERAGARASPHARY